MGNGGTGIAVHAIGLFDKPVACRSFDKGDVDAGAYLAKLDYVFVLQVVILEDYLEDWGRAIDMGKHLIFIDFYPIACEIV